MASLLCLIIGLLVGYYARQVYDNIKDIQERLQAKREYTEAGIVRPKVTRITPQIDLTISPTGGVRRPTPDEYLIANMKGKDGRLK